MATPDMRISYLTNQVYEYISHFIFLGATIDQALQAQHCESRTFDQEHRRQGNNHSPFATGDNWTFAKSAITLHSFRFPHYDTQAAVMSWLLKFSHTIWWDTIDAFVHISIVGFFEEDASIFVVISYAYQLMQNQAKKEIVNLLAEVKSLIVVS